MATPKKKTKKQDYLVADISLAPFGRKEMDLAEQAYELAPDDAETVNNVAVIAERSGDRVRALDVHVGGVDATQHDLFSRLENNEVCSCGCEETVRPWLLHIPNNHPRTPVTGHFQLLKGTGLPVYHLFAVALEKP